MQASWDVLPTTELLKECLRVLKPGGWAMWLMTPRQDSMATFISRLGEAGFNVNFSTYIILLPKDSRNLYRFSKAVDRRLGATREVLGTKADFAIDGSKRNATKHRDMKEKAKEIEHEYGYKKGWDAPVDVPASPEAKLLDGWHTMNLKPAVEVIIVSQKPLSEKSFTDQALQYAKEKLEGKDPKMAIGGVDIDSCRIPYENSEDAKGIGNLGAGLETSSESKWGYKERFNREPERVGTLQICSFQIKCWNLKPRVNRGRPRANEPSTEVRGLVYGDYRGYGKPTEPRGDEGDF